MQSQYQSEYLTKAEQVGEEYNEAHWDNISSEGCYALAVAAAHTLGGIEIYNSNSNNGSKSFAPTVEFEFDDSSSMQVTYESVFAIAPNQPR